MLATIYKEGHAEKFKEHSFKKYLKTYYSFEHTLSDELKSLSLPTILHAVLDKICPLLEANRIPHDPNSVIRCFSANNAYMSSSVHECRTIRFGSYEVLETWLSVILLYGDCELVNVCDLILAPLEPDKIYKTTDDFGLLLRFHST